MSARIHPAAAAAVLLVSLAATSAMGQLNYVYQAKTTCGFQTGQVPLLSDANPFPHQWENFKPGNYATSVNITNSTLQDRTVYGYLSLTEYPDFPLLFLGSATIPLFGSLEVGCEELMAAFPSELAQGQFVEGVLNLFASGDFFDVQGVYSFESRDAFERHLFIGFDSDTDTIRIKEKHGSGVALLPATDPDFAARELAGSGAGGLGLGGSVDVEDIEPRSLASPTTTDELDVRATRVRDNLIPSSSEPTSQTAGN